MAIVTLVVLYTLISAIFLYPSGTTMNAIFLFITFKFTKNTYLLALIYLVALILSIKPYFRNKSFVIINIDEVFVYKY